MMTPYDEKMTELLSSMSLTPVPEWEGVQTEALSADLSGAKLRISLYHSEKTAKAALFSLMVDDKTNVGLCTVFPSEKYILPVYFSKWNETQERLAHLVDLMPAVDSLVDEPFRKNYLEPMGTYWDRFSHLPGICPEEDDDLRSACSIIYTAANALIEKDGQRLASFAAHSEYLKNYQEFTAAAQACDDTSKIEEARRRKKAVSGIIKQHIEKLLSSAAAGRVPDDVLSKSVTLITQGG